MKIKAPSKTQYGKEVGARLASILQKLVCFQRSLVLVFRQLASTAVKRKMVLHQCTRYIPYKYSQVDTPKDEGVENYES